MILALYVGGFMEQLFMESAVRLAPIDTIRHGISSVAGIQCSIVAFILFSEIKLHLICDCIATVLKLTSDYSPFKIVSVK